MALTEQEKQIVEYGKKNGKTPQEVMSAISNFRKSNPQPKKKLGSETIGDIKGVVSDIKGSIEERKGKMEDIRQASFGGEQGKFRGFMQTLGQVAGTASDIIGAGAKGAVKAVLPQRAEERVSGAIEAGAGAVGELPVVQNLMSKYEGLKETNPKLARDIDAALGIGSLALDIGGFGAGSAATKGVKTAVGEVGEQAIKQAGRAVSKTVGAVADVTKTSRNVLREILPTTESIVGGNVSKAFGLTPTDVTNLEKTMGKSLSKWLQEKDLIKTTKAETEKAIDELYSKSYKQVRDEIGKVTKSYTVKDVPRYKQVLAYLKKESDQIGLEGSVDEIDTLIKKDNFTLNDVQRIKELVDDNYNLYLRSGDPAAGRAKEGLRNVRSELRSFIEKEVKDNTGADIGALNRDVASAYKLADKAKIRAGRAVTGNEVTLSDIGTFGATGIATTPLVGVAAVFAKKVLQSPTIRLQIAKYIQKLPSTQKLKIAKTMNAGKIPVEFNRFIKAKKALSKAVDTAGGIAGVGVAETTKSIPKDND